MASESKCKLCGCWPALMQRQGCICECHGKMESSKKKPPNDMAAMAVAVG